jgi:hypothetical protein
MVGLVTMLRMRIFCLILADDAMSCLLCFFVFFSVMSVCNIYLSEGTRCMPRVCGSFVLEHGGEGLVFELVCRL